MTKQKTASAKHKNMNTQPKMILQMYSYWFYAPAIILFSIFFLVPTAFAFYISLNRWSPFNTTFIEFQNYERFFRDPQLVIALKNTFIYAFLTSSAKVIISLPLAVLLTSGLHLQSFFRSVIFFPVLVSAVAVGITFSTLMQPSDGLINMFLGSIGLPQPDWLGDPKLAIYSVAIVDIWKGIGIATLIFIAGITSIPQAYFDAASLEGGAWVKFRHVILPLSRNATFTVILLSLIGGFRTFDIIWTTTGGGPGFASDVLTSVIYKQYQAGFYGLSAAGNVVLFILVMAIVYPLMRFLNSREIEL